MFYSFVLGFMGELWGCFVSCEVGVDVGGWYYGGMELLGYCWDLKGGKKGLEG